MYQQIIDDIKAAMKAKDKEKLTTIRMVKAAIKNEELKIKKELDDNQIIQIICKEIKTRKESIEEFKKGSREDLINKTNKEIEILKKYLPEQLTKDQVENIIAEAFNKIKPQSMKEMGKIMKEITPKITGRFDIKQVSNIVKEKINNI